MYNCIIDDRYPYHIDFYIKSLDIFIEINGHWTHNTHLFNPNDPADITELNILLEKAKNNSYYKSAVKVWSETDPQK